MYKTYGCIISFLLLFSLSGTAQRDSLSLQGIRMGVDIVPTLKQVITGETKGIEAALDIDLLHHLYLVLEGGSTTYEYSQYNYRYENKGTFLRLGIDRNMLKPENNPGNDMLSLGLRFGISWFSHAATEVDISSYWGRQSLSIERQSAVMPFLEGNAGIKTEVMKNLFLGWNLRMGLNLKKIGSYHLTPVYIPGIGQAEKKVNVGFHYYLAYRLPLKK